jgi:SAM-dependent methyltransferase
MLDSPDASPFAGTAQYYDRFRAPYAQAAIDFIVERYNLSEGVRALDLGCGPGTIAIPLSHTVAEVVAVDPDADMIAEGRRLATSTGRLNIQWLQSRAEDISPEAGPFQVTTIGQAFHWMDRGEVLRKLAILTAHGSATMLRCSRRNYPGRWSASIRLAFSTSTSRPKSSSRQSGLGSAIAEPEVELRNNNSRPGIVASFRSKAACGRHHLTAPDADTPIRRPADT